MVPQWVNNFSNQIFSGIRDMIFKKQQKVNVGMDALLFPSVSTKGNDSIGIFVDSDPGADNAMLKGFTKVVIQDARVQQQKIHFLSRKEIILKMLTSFPKSHGCIGKLLFPVPKHDLINLFGVVMIKYVQ
jgi:hypothetical protein